MKRIKSAPANIAEMVNRKKLISEKPISKLIIINTQSENKNKIVYSKTQKNIEKTINSVMLDYLDNSKQQFNANDEEVVIISLLYYYICEKVFTKKNLNEFMLIISGNNELIMHNIALILHKI